MQTRGVELPQRPRRVGGGHVATPLAGGIILHNCRWGTTTDTATSRVRRIDCRTCGVVFTATARTDADARDAACRLHEAHIRLLDALEVTR